jgi:hypothetical protein
MRRILFNGRPVEGQRDFPIIIAGNELPQRDVIYAFDSEESFDDWTRSNGLADKINRAKRSISEARALRTRSSFDDVIRRQRTLIDRINIDLQELSQRTGLSLGTRQFFERAIQTDIFEGRIFDPGIFYEHVNYEGHWLPMGNLSYPKLSWHGWDNRISSLQFGGLGCMFEHSWFEGAQYWMVAEDTAYLGDFWNDRASSLWSGGM